MEFSMSLLKRIKNPLAWTIISTFLALLGLYAAMREPETDLSIELISAVSVLDINKSVKDLNILFQGQDIKKNNLSLKILSIRFMNTGGKDILQSFYDKQDTLGLQVVTGRLIEARITSTNYDYLSLNVNPKIINEHLLQIDKVIFERGKYFTLELLVIHDKDRLPEIRPVGKIAGIDAIQVINTWDTEGSANFVSEVFSGGILVQIVRLLVYFIGLIIVIVLLVTITDSWSEWKQNRITKRRRQMIDGLLSYSGEISQNKSIADFVRNTFEDYGLEGLKQARALLLDDEKLNGYLELNQLQTDIADIQGEAIYLQPSYRGLSELIDTGIVSIDEDGVKIDMDLLNLLNSAIRHFEKNSPNNV